MPLVPIEEIFVPHTTTKVLVNSLGNRTQYYLTPDDGYVLHFKTNDLPIYDHTYENIVGYTEQYSIGGGSVGINHDFSVRVADTYTYTDENGMTVSIPIERIGEEELYTLPIEVVPTNQIYGGVDNDHEVMSIEEPEQAEKV